MPVKKENRKEKSLRRCERRYLQLKAQLQEIPFVLQGSIAERWMKCGKAGCRCQDDPKARHGPYYHWTWKKHNKTVSVYLDKQQAGLCKQWIAHNRRLQRIIKQMYAISWRVAQLREIAPK